ncbi:MAG: hypothetical protein AAFV93_13610 [Chloroflexota bacterium]
MSKKDRTIWEDIVDLGREVLDEIDKTMNPDKRRKPARVPIPVRTDYPPVRDPNNDNAY